MRDKLVCGIRNARIQTQLLNKTELSFEDACAAALNLQMAEEEMKDIKPEPTYATPHLKKGTSVHIGGIINEVIVVYLRVHQH